MEIKSTETIKQAVIAGMGVSFLSAHTICLEVQAGNLAVLDVQDFPLMLNWYVVHRKNKHLPPVATAFKRFLMSDGASLIQQIVGLNPQSKKRTRGVTSSNILE
jgi:DNA-binding transcriptional LysR family regulator